jgi:hypothetical protein
MSDDEEQVPQGPVPFAAGPALLAGNELLDFRTKTAADIYKRGCKPLEDRHDLAAENLRDFLDQLQDRANDYDWNAILEIPTGTEDALEYKHLITNYGEISLEDVKKHAATYVNGAVRAAQDSRMMANCIKKTLTVEARNTITLSKDDYTFNGIISGACLLKVVIQKTIIDSNATTRIIREDLSKLDAYMVTIDSDILKFNDYVQELLESLHARGETTQDLLPNLFKAYANASDKVFVKYIEDKKNEFDEGKDIDGKTLMLLAANKFKTMKTDRVWNAPSKEEEQLIALRAEMNKMKKENKARAKGKGGDGKSKGKTTSFKKRKPSWMKIPPKEGAMHKRVVKGKKYRWSEKIVDGTTYYWCEAREIWGTHSPDECQGKGWKPGMPKKRNSPEKEEKQGKTGETSSQKQSSKSNKRVRIAKAFMGYLNGSDSEDSDE